MLLLDLKGNVLGHLYHPRDFRVKALILSESDSIFVLTILNIGRKREGGEGLPAPIKFFLNFPSMILHQHLSFSGAVRISLTLILT